MSKKILDHSSVKRNYRFLAILHGGRRPAGLVQARLGP